MVHLHTHSYYSFLDAVLRPDEIVCLAVSHGAPAVALTDINNMSGVVQFVQAATEAGIKPIIGAEIRQPFPSERSLTRNRKSHGGFAPRLENSAEALAAAGLVDDLDTGVRDTNSHSASPALCHGNPDLRAVLLARNFAGYSEISRIVTRRMLDDDFDLLREIPQLSNNVILLTDSPRLLHLAAAHPGADHYGILIPSRHRRRVNRAIYEAAVATNSPLVVTCDVKLGTAQDARLHTLLQAMRRLTTVHHIREDEKIDPAQHFQSADDIHSFFGLDNPSPPDPDLNAAITNAITNTTRIADQCDCKLPLGEWKFPRIDATPEEARQRLREFVDKGLAWRYGTPLPDEVRKRADYELGVIAHHHFTDYFLLVHKIVARAQERNFFIIGRGSAANSIVTYALGISNVCPIKHDLYFERFLNPQRSVPPDIDIDFSWKERDEIIEWCYEHFGQDHVALISTIQTFRSRQSIREVAKALGISESEVNQFTRLAETGYKVEEPAPAASNGRRGRPRVHNLLESEPWRTIVNMAQRIQGFPRHFSVHCGGIVVTPGPVTDWVPLSRSAKGYAVTQLDMYGAEDLGLIKIDLLGNRSLGVLKDALNQSEAHDKDRAQTETGLRIATYEPTLDHHTINTATFQREAVRMKLAGTRRGTTVALAGVIQGFGGNESTTATPIAPDVLVTQRVFNFSHVTADPATRAMIDEGKTMGCFYIESPGMRALFERLRCTSYEEVVAASSIIRPGVAESGMMAEYISRHKNNSSGDQRSKKVVINPLMQRILPETYGVMVYQEDVLRVAHEVAGLSYSQADVLRRAMSGKHRSSDSLAKLEDQFMSGAVERGLSREDAGEIWRQISSFAGYSFCKGHSAAFAVLSYQIAYLKAHYPAEFFAGLLTNQGGFYGPGAYLQEARRWGVNVFGPGINESEDDYTGTSWDSAPPPPSDQFTGHSPRNKGSLRVGLLAIKGLSCHAREIILTERHHNGPYMSLRDFLHRTRIGAEECRMLIKAGALDCLHPRYSRSLPWHLAIHHRPALLLELATITNLAAPQTDSFFSADSFLPLPSFSPGPTSRNQPEPLTRAELCGYENENLGFPVSAHPIELVRLPADVVPARDIRLHDGKRIRMAGLCIAAKILEARNCGKPMKMLTMEDLTDTFEAVMFPRIYERFAPRTLGRGPYIIEGKVDMTLGSPTINVERVDNLAPTT